MIGFFVSALLAALAWLPAKLLRFWRRRRLTRVGVLVLALDGQGPAALAAVVEELQAAASEGFVRGVLVRLGDGGLGWASAAALHDALVGLRASGRLVVVQLDAVTNGSLYAACGADRILLAPTADAMLNPVSAELTFFGAALARLGLQAEVVAAGAFKSAGEPFARAFPSAESRQAMRELVAELQAQLVAVVAEGRGVPPEQVEDWVTRAPMSGAEAAAEGMVDGLAYGDQVEAFVQDLIGVEARWVPFGRYARWRRIQARLDSAGRRRPTMAVVHLEGNVVDREGSTAREPQIDAERVVPTLNALMDADDVRGVILAIRSPGGSAQASDDIARAVELLARRKPVLAVLGDVAASGGYYIAAPAARIIAAPGTITGSIGVVGGKLVIRDGAARLGVYTERVSAGEGGGMLGPWEPFSPEQAERFAASLGRFYARFLMVVSGGRRAPVRAIEPAAQGRVWTGNQAMARGLVDSLGGLSEGLDQLAALLGVPRASARVVHVGFPVSRLAAISQYIRGSDSVSALLAPLLAASGSSLGFARALALAPGRPLALLAWRVDGAGDA